MKKILFLLVSFVGFFSISLGNYYLLSESTQSKAFKLNNNGNGFTECGTDGDAADAGKTCAMIRTAYDDASIMDPIQGTNTIGGFTNDTFKFNNLFSNGKDVLSKYATDCPLNRGPDYGDDSSKRFKYESSTEGTIVCWYWDDQAPTFVNPKLGGVSAGGNVYANNNFTFEIDSSDLGGAGVLGIRAAFEDNDNQALTGSERFGECTGGKCKITGVDFSNVDGPNDTFRTSNGGRDVSMSVYGCDKAGNCTGKSTYTWHVFANDPTKTSNSTIATTFSLTKVGDNNDYHEAKLTLKDEYGNEVVTASGIHRTVDLAINYNNTVYLDQHKVAGGSGIRYQNRNEVSNNYFNISSSDTMTPYYTYDSIDDGIYYVRFKSYVPTIDGDVQGNGSFNFKSLKYVVKDDINDPTNGGKGYFTKLMGTASPLKYKQYVYTTITGIPPLALEGTYEDLNIKFTKNGSLSVPSDMRLLVEYNENGSPIDTYLSSGGEDYKPRCIAGNSYSSSSISTLSCGNSFNAGYAFSSSLPFREKFNTQAGKVLDQTNLGFISTHVAVKYSDGVVGTWNSAIVGRINYNYGAGTADTKLLQQSALKIKGSSSTSDFSKINQIFTGGVRYVGGGISKTELKNTVRKTSMNMIRGVQGEQVVGSKNFVFGSTPHYSSKGISLYYYYGSDFKINIPSNNSISQGNLIIVKGGDVYINGDLQYGKDGILGIISLRDSDTGEGGNVYISTTTTNVDSYIFADGGVISYKGSKYQDTLGQDDLSNQLRLKGVLWTFNTLGASRSKTPTCPYFIPKSSCDLKTAQLYDLEYMRRFYLVSASLYDDGADKTAYIPYDNGLKAGGAPTTKLIGGIKCQIGSDVDTDGDKDISCIDSDLVLSNVLSVGTNLFGANGKTMQKTVSDNIAPVIIEYDPKFKTTYLPIFSDNVSK